MLGGRAGLCWVKGRVYAECRELPVPFLCGPISSRTRFFEGYSPSGRVVYAGGESPAAHFFTDQFLRGDPFLRGPVSLRGIKATSSCNIPHFCPLGRGIYAGWELSFPISSWTNFLRTHFFVDPFLCRPLSSRTHSFEG